jgi:hypothetical protein
MDATVEFMSAVWAEILKKGGGAQPVLCVSEHSYSGAAGFLRSKGMENLLRLWSPAPETCSFIQWNVTLHLTELSNYLTVICNGPVYPTDKWLRTSFCNCVVSSAKYVRCNGRTSCARVAPAYRYAHAHDMVVGHGSTLSLYFKNAWFTGLRLIRFSAFIEKWNKMEVMWKPYVRISAQKPLQSFA